MNCNTCEGTGEVKKVVEGEAKEESGRKPGVKYLYYRIDFINCGLDFDYTIVSDLDEVRDYLQMVDSDLDDEDAKAEVRITGVGMTEEEYGQFVAKLEKEA